MWERLKRWPVLLALLVALGLLAVGSVCLPYGSRVTPANCARIKEGMTEAEVRAVLGKPWDNSLLDPESPCADLDFLATLVSEDGDSEPKAPMHNRFWVGGNLILIVAFDRNDQVVSTVLDSGPDPPRSWLPVRVWRRLRARYGW